MTLLELHVDVGRIADSLEKLVVLLEKLVFPPPPADVKIHQATVEDLRHIDESVILKMQEEKSEFARRYNVVEDSPAFAQALHDWEAQMRSIYGEEWQPPEDWRKIVAQAERRAGAGGEQARAPSQAAK